MESTNDKLNKEYITSNKKSKRETKTNKNDSNVVKSGDSYEERICDDLSEVILQYLSLEDKLRLECVSQQFRRTLFTKQYSLEIIEKMKKINLETIEKLLKKLTNLNEIEFFNTYETDSEFVNINRMFAETLIKNNNNLTKVVLFTNKYKQLLNKDFIDKFGSTLVSLQIYNPNHNEEKDLKIPYLSQLSNIEELLVYQIPDLTDLHFTRLKRLKILIVYDEDIETLKVLFEDNKNTLKHIKICMFKANDEISFCKTLLSLIRKLKNLIDFQFDYSLIFDKQINPYLTQIALNCYQLKRVSFEYKIDENHRFEDLLSTLNRFKALKHLILILTYSGKSVNYGKTMESDLSTLIKCETFRELTQLDLCFGVDYRLLIGSSIGSPIDANNVFKDIEKNLPKLQSFIIEGNEFYFNANTTHILSQLSDLQTIELFISKESAKHEIETNLKEKCKQIKRIDFKVEDRLVPSIFENLSNSENSSDSD